MMDHHEQPASELKRQTSDCDDRTRTRKDYTVGWICALFEEQVAATAMLEQIHLDLPKPPNDPNAYTLGSINQHGVVIACLPNGKYGNNPAGTCANHMVRTFQSVRMVLMVGIGGGIPPKVKLGDVVISTPVGQFSGVIQWDLGKAEKGGKFKPVGLLNNPATALLTAVSKMRTRHMLDGHRIPYYLDEMGERFPRLIPQYTQSTSLIDPLFRDVPDQAKDDPKSISLHYGLIASGNQVIKDANLRDKIDESFDGNVLCIEMEAAALMDNFPCIVIRGICDYADSMKEKSWQTYAAAIAAACAKELLHYVQPSEVDADLPVRSILGDVIKAVRNTETQVKSMRTQLDREEDLRILDWFSKAGYGPRHSEILKMRQPGTGQWFLDSAQYRVWRSQERQTLLCTGIPGSGKTMIAAIAIDHLTTTLLRHQSSGLAYIYCAFDRYSEQTIENLLSSLIKQLSKGQPSLPNAVKELFSKHQEYSTRPSCEELSRTLLAVTSIHKQVFIVVDALDECQSSDGRLRQLLSQIFALQSKANINFLATSRPIPEIEKQLKTCITQTIRASEKDIRSFISGRMSQLPDFINDNSALQEEIKIKIIEVANGMFLIVRLYLDSLVGLHAPRAVRTALERLPRGSDAYDYAYSQAMQRIKSQAPASRTTALKALMWITGTKRQLRVPELQHALAIEDGDTELDTSGIPSVAYILSVCAGLVTVDEESDSMRLVHYTTQEYFNRTRILWFPDAEVEITSICIRYLSFHTFRKPCSSETSLMKRLQAYKLYEYAAHYWGHHARLALTLCSEVCTFLGDESLVESSSQVIIRRTLPTKVNGLHRAAFFGLEQAIIAIAPKSDQVDPRDCHGQTPLSIAAQEGHDRVACLLLDRGAEIESRDSIFYRTPLFYAVAKGHLTTVQLLLQGGAKPDSRGICHTTPLSCAATQGHETLVQLLLDWGADINAKNINNLTPLALAAANGDERVVQTILDKGPQLELKDNTLGQTALIHAAAMGHQAVVKLLIEHGANIEIRDFRLWSPLYYALRFEHDEIVRLLLENGVKWDISGNLPATALHWAITSSCEGMVQLLLDRGADIEQKDFEGNTVLGIAVSEGLDSAVQILLSRGADWKSQNRWGKTPLEQALYLESDSMVHLFLDRDTDHASKKEMSLALLSWASSTGHLTFARLSIKKGARINGKDRYGSSPLTIAAAYGHASLVKLFLKRGADLELKDSRGRTALFNAAAFEHTPVIKLLMKNGASVETKDENGRTPLAYAADLGLTSMVELMLEHGANPDSTDNNGSTPLIHAAERGHTSVVDLLLEHGANPDSTDNNGSTPLIQAAKQGHTSVVDLLLEKGASLESRDNDGDTPLAKAAQEGISLVVKRLLQKGANIESKNNQGSSPLAWAALRGNADAVRVLLQNGADVESKDKGGFTPLAKVARRPDLRREVIGIIHQRVIKLPLLLWATRPDPIEVVKLLLDNGANMEAEDEAGISALAWAERERDREVL